MNKFFIFTALFFVCLCIFFIWQITLTPSHKGNWRDENKLLPSISINKNQVTIKNFRDFYIDESGKKINNWEEKSFIVDDIEGVDFLISHFHKYHGIAHVFVSFRLKNQENISISMEARMEAGQKYSPIAGLFNQFEMMYVIGSERDIIGSRIGYRNEEVYLYQTSASAQTAKKLFLSFTKDINSIYEKPLFYNTLWRNCTTAIIVQIEKVLEKNIWWSYEHLLPGYADKKAFKMEFLAYPKNFHSLSFKSETEKFLYLQEKSKISGKKISQWDKNFESNIRKQ